MRRAVGRVLAVIAVLALLLAPYLWLSPETMWCDGRYQRFQIADDYDGGGCSRIIPGWHAIFPWNWDELDTVCLGMCVELQSPDDRSAFRGRAVAPGAVMLNVFVRCAQGGDVSYYWALNRH